MPKRHDHLPSPKFTDAERAAYCWLWECGYYGWSVDLVTKKVFDADRPEQRHESLVAFAKSKGWECDTGTDRQSG